ncbi:MAG: queuosine precursor transporter [Bacteroidales bacterium]|nr:queuosine precursor transporter [Bacteroidales bacterium]
MKAKKVSVAYMWLAIVFVTCLIASNMFEAKLIAVGDISVTAGLLCFPISYIIGDVTTEVYGFKAARRVIWAGFAMNFFVVALGGIACMLPAPDFWTNGEAFDTVFGLAPRIAAASLTAFVTGSIVNAWVMDRMHHVHEDRFFGLRAIASTIAGETVDSVIFFPIAFGGTMPANELFKMMVVQIVLKTLYEVIILPVTIQVVKFFKKLEAPAA